MATGIPTRETKSLRNYAPTYERHWEETSRRSRNRNQYLYVRSIGPGCCPTATQGGEWLSLKIPGAALWNSSTCTAWRRHPRWIVCPSEPFYGIKNGVIAEREVWTVWRVTKNLPLEFLQECRDCVGCMKPCIIITGREIWAERRVSKNLPLEFLLVFSHVTCTRDPLAAGSELPHFCRNHSLLHNDTVTCLHIPDPGLFLNASGSFLF